MTGLPSEFATVIIAALACAAWSFALFLRGGFWRAAERDDAVPPAPIASGTWPRVVAIVPARDEAHVIGTAVTSLLRQDYPGAFEIVVVDDHSTDGTAAVARAAAADAGAANRLAILSAPDLPVGWTGKLWAMNCGVDHVASLPATADYLLFTDADIGYSAETLRALVTRAQREGLVLTSLMAQLHCESFAERALIPAFIFFFQMLYPFAWVNRPKRRRPPLPAAACWCGTARCRRRGASPRSAAN